MMSGAPAGQQGSLTALSLVAANPEAVLIAGAVIGGIAITVAGAKFVYSEIKHFEEKKHLAEITAVNKLHDQFLTKIPVPGKNETLSLPTIFKMKSEKDINSVDSLHFNDDIIQAIADRLPRGTDIALAPYQEAILNAILKLKEYYFSRSERNDITSSVIAYLLQMLDSHCLKFEGYDYDIAYLQAMASFINAYASKDERDNTKTFTHLDEVYSHIVTAQHYLDLHKDKLSLHEIISDLNDSCRYLSDKSLRYFSMIINPSETWDLLSNVTKQELSQGMLKKYYIAHDLFKGLITIPDKELDVLPSPFKDTLINLTKYALKSIDPDITLTFTDGCDFHILPSLPTALKDYKNCYIFSNKKLIYVKPDGSSENVSIKDIALFRKTLATMNSGNAALIHLNHTQLNTLITTNGGHSLNDIPTIDIVIPDLNRYLELKSKVNDDKVKLTQEEKAEKKKIKNQLEDLKNVFYKCKNFITTELDPKTRKSKHKFISVTEYNVLVERVNTICNFANFIREIISLQYYSMNLIKGIKLLGEIDVTSPQHKKVFKAMDELCGLVQSDYLKLKKDFYKIQEDSDNAMQIRSATTHRDNIYSLLETTNTNIGNARDAINKYWDKNKKITKERKVVAEHNLFDAADLIGKAHSLPFTQSTEHKQNSNTIKHHKTTRKSTHRLSTKSDLSTNGLPDISTEIDKKGIVPTATANLTLKPSASILKPKSSKLKLVTPESSIDSKKHEKILPTALQRDSSKKRKKELPKLIAMEVPKLQEKEVIKPQEVEVSHLQEKEVPKPQEIEVPKQQGKEVIKQQEKEVIKQQEKEVQNVTQTISMTPSGVETDNISHEDIDLTDNNINQPVVNNKTIGDGIRLKLIHIQGGINTIKKEEKPSANDAEGRRYFEQEIKAYLDLYSSLVGVYQKIKSMMNEGAISSVRNTKITHMLNVLATITDSVDLYTQKSRRQRIEQVSQFNQSIQQELSNTRRSAFIDGHDNDFWKAANSVCGAGFFKTDSRGKLINVGLACNSIMQILTEEGKQHVFVNTNSNTL